jgi:hypothetical protein
MATTSDPRLTYRLSDFIEAGKSVTFTYNNFSFIEIMDNMKYPIYNVINDYLYELKLYSIRTQLSEEEQYKYFYRPKLLASDIYGNSELGFVILALNSMCNVKEFTLPIIKMLNIDDMQKFITQIYNSEKKSIQIYNSGK